MRSLRLFYSNPELTCGQLVIASPESQYKILHFHHGGLDKLAQLFEQWNVVRAKSKEVIFLHFSTYVHTCIMYVSFPGVIVLHLYRGRQAQ